VIVSLIFFRGIYLADSLPPCYLFRGSCFVGLFVCAFLPFIRMICICMFTLQPPFSSRSVLCTLGNMMDCQLYQDVLSALTLTYHSP
jgi:hypothetical protein